MFKLPVCPHCHTIYRYGEVRKTAAEKKHICYHCKKEFAVSKKGIIFLFFAVVFAAVIINVAQLYITPSLNILIILITNVIIAIIGNLFKPFFISYKKIDKNKNDKINSENKKNK